MERLTEKTVGCFEYALKDHKAVPGEFGTYDAFFDYSMAVKRLGHYEDTGLEPEEIYEVRFLIAAQRDPQKLARLRELVLADQDGRLHITPAFVWHNGDSGLHEVPYKPWMAQWIATGTKFWLTREEAEAALAQKGGDG